LDVSKSRGEGVSKSDAWRSCSGKCEKFSGKTSPFCGNFLRYVPKSASIRVTAAVVYEG
jgi:hypothetical protein